MKMEVGDISISPVLHEPIPGEFSVSLVGDMIYLRPMLTTLEAHDPRLLEALRSADIGYGNVETNVFDLETFQGSPQAESGGSWLLAPPSVASDIRMMGISLASLANNHATDWGVEGLLETMHHLDKAGIVHAGAGRTMASARLASYADGPRGRVALVSASATYTSMSRAADPLGMVPGRPGINTLAVSPVAHVSPEQYATIAAMAGSVDSFWTRVRPASTMLMGGNYVPDETLSGPEIKLHWDVDQADRIAILKSIRQASQNSNFVIFSFHTHEPSNESQEPATFAVEIARAAVDAGADIVVCHGPHQLRGIEIHESKPIFYSLGNFAMMSNSLDVIPKDTYDSCRIDPASDATVPEVLSARNGAVFGNPALDESVIAVAHFIDGRSRGVELIPIDIGTDAVGALKGVPRSASQEVCERIIDRLAAMSSPFGVDVGFDASSGRAWARVLPENATASEEILLKST